MPARKDLSGQRFSHLSVIDFAGIGKNGHALWRCLCDCGTEKVIVGHKLTEGEAKSCGCMHYKYGHGKTETRLYHIWRTMKARCLSKTSNKYKNYGGRGIKVCDEWRDNFQCFYDWSMANGYTDELTIDRIDVDGNYQPDNCQWITPGENSKKAWEDRRRKESVGK